MTHTEAFKKWIEKAAADLEAAEGYRNSGTAYEVPAFLCHQAVEKALNGYLLSVGEGPVDSHDLPFLGKCAEKGLPELGEMKAELALVNRYYLEMTYPDDLRYDVSAAIVDQCIQVAGRVLRVVRGAVEGNG